MKEPMRKLVFPVLLILSIVLTSCNLPTSRPPEIPTATVSLPTVAVITATLAAPTATDTPAPTNTPAPTATNTVAPLSDPASGNYIDDRSTPSQVIVSYFNAVNRKEYLRAYNYWRTPATSLGSFSSFANGYADTAAVSLVFGQITGDAGAGQMYYTVPVILKATSTTGVRANWAACYVVHLAQPGFFGAPPFEPMGIDRGSAKPASLSSDDATVLSTACSGYPTGGNAIATSGSTLNIDKNNYLDNRSGPIETVSSLLNALNLKQYVRAYSYFQNPSTYPGAYDPYAAGFSDTDVITATFGTAINDAGAGNLYYKVPLVMKVLTTSGSTQTFAGCYTLHLSQPAVQGTPPFRPLGITAGKFTLVSNSADVNSLLTTACN